MPDISVQGLVWLFLAAFMIHDLEEIITVEPWMKINKPRVLAAIPGGPKRYAVHMLGISSSQFAVAVLLEFIIFIPFTFAAAEHGKYFVFLAFNTLLLLHVFTHLRQSLYLKSYTPGVVTAVVIVLPYTLFLFYRLLADELITWGEILFSIPVGFLLLPIVVFGHVLGKRVVN